MRWTLLGLAAVAGMTGCTATSLPASEGPCIGLWPHVRALERALVAHPEAPDAVGEAGVDVVIAYDAGCPR